jgi:hypothetical protein
MTTTNEVCNFIISNLPNHEEQLELVKAELAKYPEVNYEFLSDISKEQYLSLRKIKKTGMNREITFEMFDSYSKEYLKNHISEFIKGLVTYITEYYRENNLDKVLLLSPKHMIEGDYFRPYIKDNKVILLGMISFTEESVEV